MNPNVKVCRKSQGKAEPGNSCLQTPGTCESCPDWAAKRRQIYAYKNDYSACDVCGKDAAKRKGRAPAPVELAVGASLFGLCMPCAKRICNVLDSVIERIQSTY